MRGGSRADAVSASKAEDSVSLDTDAELDRRLEQLRDDVSNGRVTEARAAAKELEVRWPESERVQYWARVLAPPRVVPTPPAYARSRPRDRERAWLNKHAREYPGCWLAVYEDRLVAADPDLEVVFLETRRELGEEGAVLYWQPGTPEKK